MTSADDTTDGRGGGETVRPRHHIDEAMLLSYAAGTLEQSASIVVATHLSLCPHCRSALRTAEAAGGALLADISPTGVAPGALADVMTRLDQPAPQSPAQSPPEPQVPQRLLGALLPQAVSQYIPSRLRWRWVSPGVKFAHVLTDATGAKLGFMHAAAGAEVAEHGHSGEELTLVLSGGFTDGAASFARGDLQTTNEDIVHQPLTDADGDCLLLVMVQGSIRPTSLLGRIFLPFTGF
jgi:putative transcriptional regulator